MTLRYLLDTMIVAAPMAKRPNRKVIRRLEQYGLYCAIASPVWHELTYGCERLPAGKRRKDLEEYLQSVVRTSFPIIPYDEMAALWHGDERARLEKIGRAIPYVDGQIAAIACCHELTLVTTNSKHFSSLKNIALADWTR